MKPVALIATTAFLFPSFLTSNQVYMIAQIRPEGLSKTQGGRIQGTVYKYQESRARAARVPVK